VVYIYTQLHDEKQMKNKIKMKTIKQKSERNIKDLKEAFDRKDVRNIIL
jgi:hypothetical protein